MPGSDQPTEHEWVQLNVALSRRDGGPLKSARCVFGALRPLMDEWRREGALSQFYFTRKPPDLRLRFRGPDCRAAVLAGTTATLYSLQCEGAVERFFTSVYEPEVNLFGGPAGMELVHAYFDADTSSWLEMDGLWACNQARLTPETLTCVVTDHLLRLALGDRSEIWDVWCTVLSMAGERPATDGKSVLPTPSKLITTISAAEEDVLRRYREHNTLLARGLTVTYNRGELQCGLRALLTWVAIFHFNRYGLDASRLVDAATAMAREWNPHRIARPTEL